MPGGTARLLDLGNGVAAGPCRGRGIPAHGQSKGTWVNPVRNNRLMYGAAKARGDKDVLAAGRVGPTRET